ncbi:MAG: seryl-tRNA synthetase, partial [Methanoculleus sp.]|nr:seryl-tRNA synthetase [Methanoculleus sp.]
MLELKFVRAHPEIVRADLTKRGDTEKLAWVDEVLEMDRRARELTVAIGD